ncbi:hypothetical protein RSOLAG1IB_00224 [Rhizoctonia solani AG-1 IB]|uniref:Uncharacterized protein n=1 Tax=Thanatephorus cucumeris (strain AG1-IB / isolate 7/3/14) TaxID=1108050 RepID=A0A0B7F432_THACB|nr:hypothetical protein RSOLAG1IB_00224 [Rhizoctonia solani AG-1 IB]
MRDFAESLIKSPPTKLANGDTIDKLGKFHCSHGTRVDIEDITILGYTLWRGWEENFKNIRSQAGIPYHRISEFCVEEML